MKVTIYVLIDPDTLRVRYIGRTTTPLNQRLSVHISKAKTTNERTHKANWLRKLDSEGKRPIIRKLTSIQGWSESYKLERELIHKYRDRLINHNDRGEGGKNTQISEETRKQISETLKRKYRSGEIPHPMEKPVYVYNMDGEYLGMFDSVMKLCKALDFHRSQIDKVLTGDCVQSRGYRFTKKYYESLPAIKNHRKGKLYPLRCRLEK